MRISGWCVAAAGATCWLFPGLVLRIFMEVGLVSRVSSAPSETPEDAGEKLGTAASALWTFWRINSAAPWLVIVGVLLLIGGYYFGSQSEPEPRRRRHQRQDGRRTLSERHGGRAGGRR